MAHADELFEVIKNSYAVGDQFTPTPCHSVAFKAGLKPPGGRLTTRKSLCQLANDGRIGKRVESGVNGDTKGEPVYERIE